MMKSSEQIIEFIEKDVRRQFDIAESCAIVEDSLGETIAMARYSEADRILRFIRDD